MIKDAVSPLEPRYEDLAGDGFGRKARRHFLATRPKFLTASVLPVLVGTAWGATGTDRDNVDYIHPYTGGSRFITNGIMSVREMHRWGWILIGMASVLGLVLALLKGPIVIALGLAGIAIAWLYSAPAVQLSGKGVGEFFLMIAFGVLPVCGAAWLQSGVFDLGSLLIAIPVGIWVMLILWINEVPDRKADAANGKLTLVVRLGLDRARLGYRLLHFAAFASIVTLVAMGSLPWWTAVGAAAILAGGFKAAAGIGEQVTRPVLTKSIEMTIGLQAVGSILLFVAAIFSH